MAPKQSADKIMQIIADFINNEDNMKTVIDLCTAKAAAKVTEDMKCTLKTLEVDVLEHMDNIVSTTSSHKELMEKRIDQLEMQITNNNIQMNLLQRKLDDTEQYTRRPNLIIDGVHVQKKENPKDLLAHITKEIVSMNIDVRAIDIDRVHRHEEPYRDNRGNLIQPVIIRFTSWYCRNELYSARKDFCYRVRADLTSRRQQIRDFAIDHVANNNLRHVVDFVAADRNCRLIMRTTAGKFHSFSSEQEFRHIIDGLSSPAYSDEYRDIKAFRGQDQADKKLLDEAKQRDLLNFMAANNDTPTRSSQPTSSAVRSPSPPPSPSKPTTSSTSDAASRNSSISSTGL